MKLGIYRVYHHTITEKDGKEVSRTSPVATIMAAEASDQLLDTLPPPPTGPAGTTVRNVIVQMHQIHRDVLYMPGIKTRQVGV